MKGLIKLDVLVILFIVMSLLAIIPLLPKLFELAVNIGISLGARL